MMAATIEDEARDLYPNSPFLQDCYIINALKKQAEEHIFYMHESLLKTLVQTYYKRVTKGKLNLRPDDIAFQIDKGGIQVRVNAERLLND